DGDEELPAQPQSKMGRSSLHGSQSARAHRQGELHDERGRLSHAGEERPAAARFALFQSGAQVTMTSRARKRLSARVSGRRFEVISTGTALKMTPSKVRSTSGQDSGRGCS